MASTRVAKNHALSVVLICGLADNYFAVLIMSSLYVFCLFTTTYAKNFCCCGGISFLFVALKLSIWWRKRPYRIRYVLFWELHLSLYNAQLITALKENALDVQ